MEWGILFVGPVGAGKSQAVRTLSDIEVVDTEARASDDTSRLKEHTTVAMDMGVIHLDSRDKLRLYGAPGQDRFDFMWDILLMQARGLVLLLDHSRPDPLADLAHYLEALHERRDGRPRPLVIGVTHADLRPALSLDLYREALERHPVGSRERCIPVLEVDARSWQDMRTLLLTLTSMLEMNERFAKAA